MTAQALLARAGVLAAANDLVPPRRRSNPAWSASARLSRRLGRPVGQSGSGPTLWVLYPSAAEAAAVADEVRAALAVADLPIVGAGEPFVEATTIAARAANDRSDR